MDAQHEQPTAGVYLKLILAVAAWGASFVATKVALRELAPVALVWLRFALGVALLGAVALARRQPLRLSARELGYFALLGFIGITLHQWLQSNGLVTAQAGTTGWIIASIPVFIALLGWLFLKEQLTWLRAAGILLAMGGVLLVVSRGQPGRLFAAGFGAPGDVLILLSAPNWAIFSVLSRPGLKRQPAAQMMFFVMTFGWLFTSAQAALGGVSLTGVSSLSAAGWLSVAFLGVICSGLAYIFWYDGLQAVPAARAGVFLYLEPLVTVVTAALVLGEPLLPVVLAGGAVILAGVWLVNR